MPEQPEPPHSDRCITLISTLERFLADYIYPNEAAEVVFENVRVPTCPTCCSARDMDLRLDKDGSDPGAYTNVCDRLASARAHVPTDSATRRLWTVVGRKAVILERIAEARIMIEQARLLH